MHQQSARVIAAPALSQGASGAVREGLTDQMLSIISLGAGVQSTAMALMAAHGEITPMPDCAIFADTQGEPVAVYEHLRWLSSANVLPFPVHVVTAGPLWDAAVRVKTRKDGGRKYIAVGMPVYLQGKTDGIGRRQCTQDFKVGPIFREIRQLAGKGKGVIAELWMGISTDEIIRMKPARKPFVKARWPLIEKRLSRGDCLAWLNRNGYPRPPKSSCTFCPYHSNEAWRSLTPDEFADAVQKERDMQAAYAKTGMIGTPYLHPSRVPLDKANILSTDQLDLFGNECEGMCGV